MPRIDDSIHPDLLATKSLVYHPCHLNFSTPIAEHESSEYGGYQFTLDGHQVKFRVAKITPTKIGQFVTLWKRLEKGPIAPFDASDPIDFCVISVRDEKNSGNLYFQNLFCANKIYFLFIRKVVNARYVCIHRG